MSVGLAGELWVGPASVIFVLVVVGGLVVEVNEVGVDVLTELSIGVVAAAIAFEFAVAASRVGDVSGGV